MTPDAALLAPTATSDEELVSRAWGGDALALEEILSRYRGFVRAKARRYFLTGGEREDLAQEGMIGLYKAVRDFDATRQVNFRGFAELCVTRQIITAIKTATRQKHLPLNSYVSLHAPLRRDEDGSEPSPLADSVAATGQDPADRVVFAEELAQLRQTLAEQLSDLETDVLRRYVAGHSYQEIAAELDRHTKAIDNALQRIKRKIAVYLADRQAREPA